MHPALDVDLENDEYDEIQIEPCSSIFYYENFALQVEEITDGGRMKCVVQQSKNHSHAVESIILFTYVDAVTNLLLNTYNS